MTAATTPTGSPPGGSERAWNVQIFIPGFVTADQRDADGRGDEGLIQTLRQ